MSPPSSPLRRCPTVRAACCLVTLFVATFLGAGPIGCGPPTHRDRIAAILQQHDVVARVDGALRARPYLAPSLADALQIWLSDERDGESLRSIVRYVGSSEQSLVCREPALERQIRCWLAQPGTSIGVDEGADEGAQHPWRARFWLVVPALSDHVFFADVVRHGHVVLARSWGEN